MNKPHKENLTVKDFLEIYSISLSRFYKEVKAGRLKTSKIQGSRLTFVKRKDAEAWLDVVGTEA
jgi:hypothetical protein